MMEMTKRERVRAALASPPVDRVPVSLWGHDFLREWSPEDLVAATLDAYRADDWDFIKFNPRWTYFAEAWGNTYERPTEQRMPRLTTATIRGSNDFARIAPLDIHAGPFAEHLRALSLLIDEAGAEVDVVQTVFSPLAVVALLCGSDERFKEFVDADRAAAHAAVDAAATTLADYARASVDAGAAGVFFAPLFWASYDTCDDALYAEFGRPYDLRVLAAVTGAPFNILHVCRNHNMLLSLLDYPVAALNWADHGDGNPGLRDARARTKKALMGGIDHAHLHPMSPAEVTEQAIDALQLGPGLLLAGGCGIRLDTPPANRAAVTGAARNAAE
jgi:uroporphyrinogen decarboxylase